MGYVLVFLAGVVCALLIVRWVNAYMHGERYL
jgi:hypothetical protein